jgi:hypothetical protein
MHASISQKQGQALRQYRAARGASCTTMLFKILKLPFAAQMASWCHKRKLLLEAPAVCVLVAISTMLQVSISQVYC